MRNGSGPFCLSALRSYSLFRPFRRRISFSATFLCVPSTCSSSFIPFIASLSRQIKDRGRKNGDSCSTTGHRIDKENQIVIPRTCIQRCIDMIDKKERERERERFLRFVKISCSVVSSIYFDQLSSLTFLKYNLGSCEKENTVLLLLCVRKLYKKFKVKC